MFKVKTVRALESKIHGRFMRTAGLLLHVNTFPSQSIASSGRWESGLPSINVLAGRRQWLVHVACHGCNSVIFFLFLFLNRTPTALSFCNVSICLPSANYDFLKNKNCQLRCGRNLLDNPVEHQMVNERHVGYVPTRTVHSAAECDRCCFLSFW